MKNIYLQWQQDVVTNLEGRTIVRAARCSGKSTVASRWVLNQLKRGQDVIWLNSLGHASNILGQLESVMEEGDVLVAERRFGNVSSIMFNNGSVLRIARGASALRGYQVWNYALVIDDADTNQSDFVSVYETVHTSLLLGTNMSCNLRMAYELKERIPFRYHEVSYHEALESGIIPRYMMDSYMKDLKPEHFQKLFGPWGPVGNTLNKHLLTNIAD